MRRTRTIPTHARPAFRCVFFVPGARSAKKKDREDISFRSRFQPNPVSYHGTNNSSLSLLPRCLLNKRRRVLDPDPRPTTILSSLRIFYIGLSFSVPADPKPARISGSPPVSSLRIFRLTGSRTPTRLAGTPIGDAIGKKGFFCWKTYDSGPGRPKDTRVAPGTRRFPGGLRRCENLFLFFVVVVVGTLSPGAQSRRRGCVLLRSFGGPVCVCEVPAATQRNHSGNGTERNRRPFPLRFRSFPVSPRMLILFEVHQTKKGSYGNKNKQTKRINPSININQSKQNPETTTTTTTP